MFEQKSLSYLYQRLAISEQAQKVIQQIRSSQPCRLVGSTCGNVSGRYPSKKMGVTIQFESHHNELAFIYEYEYDPEVLEYYDQPSKIKLNYSTKDNRKLNILHTPDFFIIRQDKAGWEECKTEKELIKLAEKSPNRYFIDERGQWRCPPGESYANMLGFYYRLRSSKEINWTKQRNLLFLEDYLRDNSCTIKDSSREAVTAIILASQGITLRELFQRFEGIISPDDVYKLITYNDIFVDLDLFPLAEADQVRVYTKKEMALAGSSLDKIQSESAIPYIHQFVNLEIGSYLQWNGMIWRIANVGKTKISLLGQSNVHVHTELQIETLETLIREGIITGVPQAKESITQSEITILLSQASPKDLEEANRKCDIVMQYLNKEVPSTDNKVSERTLRLWASQYRNAYRIYGNGYVGLLPKRKNSGNRQSKLSEQVHKFMLQFIENEYETLKQKPKFEVWASLKLACDKEAIVCPSYKTFCKAVNSRDSYHQVYKRRGYKAAYDRKPFYWNLEVNISRHGERPFEICHIDHTELDIELVCSQTGQNLGRSWVTFLIDAYSRRILAIFLSFDPPSYRSCMMVIRECVRLHGRLPQTIVVDNGAEFKSVYFDTLLARYECTKKMRPPSQARFGSVCERLFGTTNSQFIHNLQGNTQLSKNPRHLSKSANPKYHALWTLEKLNEYLCQYAYEVYDTLIHPALGQSPRTCYENALKQLGSRVKQFVHYNQEFLIFTLPTTKKGLAKIQPGKGIKINSIMYWCDTFRNPKVENLRVPVRYDPYNISIAYVYVEKQWIQCFSEYFTILNGRSEKELMMVTKELRSRYKNQKQSLEMTGRKIAEFLQLVNTEEKLLLQNRKDREASLVTKSKKEKNLREIPTNIEETKKYTKDLKENKPQDLEMDSDSYEIYGEF